MSGSEWAMILTAMSSLVAATLSGLAVLLTIWVKADVHLARAEVDVVKDDVRKIEIATNSMKDALVKATGEAKFAEGASAERDKQIQAKAAVADARDAVHPTLLPPANVQSVLEGIAEQVVVKIAEVSEENKKDAKKEQIPVTLPPAQAPDRKASDS